MPIARWAKLLAAEAIGFRFLARVWYEQPLAWPSYLVLAVVTAPGSERVLVTVCRRATTVCLDVPF
jgi:hypothetical protein